MKPTKAKIVFVTALASARKGALNDEGSTFGKMLREDYWLEKSGMKEQ
ncbi:MAG: hypothetical protein IJI41_03670 [Anaerolineaceae bacterium]|nr:hypothetical protein [Anaerolineaceae bacterium]